MAFPVLTLEQVRANLLRDIRNYRPDADVTPDSDFYVRATSVASAVEGLYQHQSWIVRQIFPDSADREYLYMHAAVRGLSLKHAVPARGYLQIKGKPGTLIAEGLQAKRGDGVLYRVRESGHIPESGSGLFAAEAADRGEIGNAVDHTPATLQMAPIGTDAAVTVQSMRGGLAQETDAQLLARLLDLIRRPPAGGNRHDYRRWAMEVEGVSDAFVYPLRRGLGTVDVAIVSAGGLPSQDTISRVKAHIEDQRPVTAKNCLVVAPDLRQVHLTVHAKLHGVTLEKAKADIAHVLASQFAGLTPGQPWVRSQAEALVSNVPGVQDRTIASPVANVVPVVSADVIEWLRVGRVTVEPM